MIMNLLHRAFAIPAILLLAICTQQADGAGKVSRQSTQINSVKRQPFGYYPVKWRRWEDVQSARQRGVRKDLEKLPSSLVPDFRSETKVSAPRIKPPVKSSQSPNSQQQPAGGTPFPTSDIIPPIPFSSGGGPIVPPPAFPDDLKEQLELDLDLNDLILPDMDGEDNQPPAVQPPAVEEKPLQQGPPPEKPADDLLDELFPKSDSKTDIFASTTNPLRRSPREEFDPVGPAASSPESIRDANNTALKNSIARLSSLPPDSLLNTTVSPKLLSSAPHDFIGNHSKQELALKQVAKLSPVVNSQAKASNIRQTAAVAPLATSRILPERRKVNPLRFQTLGTSLEDRVSVRNSRLLRTHRNPLRSE